MKIYPKCFYGGMEPYITSFGYLLPCCQVTKLTYDKTKPFHDEEFNLNKKTFSEIATSPKWNTMIKSFSDTDVPTCIAKCGSPEGWNNKFIPLANAKSIQFETTNRCTLQCLYCSRTKAQERGIEHLLNKNDLDINILEDVFKSKHWESVIDCGTSGDSIFYRYYHEMLNMMTTTMIDHYRLSIAATGRTSGWWDDTQRLWKELNDSGISVIIYWGIDGLKDTSNIHRIGQNWDEITEQMRISIENGVTSSWQFIPFSHNEHQIDEANRLANEWGARFHLKPSDRFFSGDPLKPKNESLYQLIENL